MRALCFYLISIFYQEKITMETRTFKKLTNSLRLFLMMSFLFFSCGIAFPQDVNSWDGYPEFEFPPHGQYRLLNLFINIIYDNPNNDPFPCTNCEWPMASTEGINIESIPTYLNTMHPDILDPDFINEPSVHGNMTRKYYESALGHLILLGDYVVVNIKQETVKPNNETFSVGELVHACVDLINSNGGLSTLFGHNSFSQYNTINDSEVDFLQVCMRNSKEGYGHWTEGLGMIQSTSNYNILFSDGLFNTKNCSYSCVGPGDLSTKYTGIIFHEFSHQFFGGNEAHSSGGCMWKGDGGGITFLGNQCGYGIMGGGNSGLISCNGYERQRLHWKSDIYNSTNSYIAANNQVSDISKQDGTKTFLLRDFVTTGDAIRIKLPYKDNEGLNQYIWLENHKIGLNGKLDFLQYSDTHACRPAGNPGIYAYYQIGKDVNTGEESVVFPSLQADNLKIISAEGNFDYTSDGWFQPVCVADPNGNPVYASKVVKSNPFLGYNDIMKQGEETNQQISTLQKHDFNLTWKTTYEDNEVLSNIPHLMNQKNPFTGSGKMNISSNPAAVNTYTYYNDPISWSSDDFNPINSNLNTRSIYLSGLSISFTQQGTDYLVNIDWDDYEVNNEVRWCGDIIHNEKLYLVETANITLDQSKTPEQKERDPVSHEFALPTLLTSNSGSLLTMDDESKIQLKNNSTMLLKSGSVTEISDNANITVESGCKFEIEPCATLVIKDAGQLIVQSGGTICMHDGAMIYINSPGNIDLQHGYLTGGCLQDIIANCIIQPPTNFSQGTTIWSGVTYKFYDNLVIPDGVTLNIVNSQIQFAPESKVIVQRNGRLILDHSQLTKTQTNCYNSQWLGVEVWGNSQVSQVPQSNQGLLRILNGGSIEYAKIGILANRHGGYPEPDIPVPGYTGGIVWCDSGYFVNNNIGAIFGSYSFHSGSYFRRTHFLTNDDMIQGELPQCFVRLDGLDLVRFYGCTFYNSKMGIFNDYFTRGIGIFSFNSHFIVDGHCFSETWPCSHWRQSVFEGLYKGIYALNSGSEHNPYISNSIFRDNLKGVYLSGFGSLSNATVISNVFKIIRPYNYVVDSCYGLYLDNCSGYHVEGNEFYTELGTADGIGLVVNNSGTLSNEVYRNNFYNLKYATLSQNVNRNYNPPLHLGGLCYKCNKFVRDDLTKPNSIDLSITYDTTYMNTVGIAKNQGTFIQYINGVPYFKPAGNMFKPTPPGGHYDIYNDGNAIDYYHHSSSTLPYRLTPDFKYGTVNLYSVLELFTESSCPSTIGEFIPDLFVEQLEEATGSADSLGNILISLVDGGSTESLNYEVESSTPPEALQIRNELLTQSPYLSDTVMKTSVIKEDVLDNAMIRDILVANPHSAKSDEIIGLLENRTVPMPDYLMEQILAGTDTVSAKEILESQKAYWDGISAKSYYRLLSYFKGDSASQANEDSLEWLMDYRNTLDAWYDKATWYHSKGEYTLANNILNSIPSAFSLSLSELETHQKFTDLFVLLEQMETDTISILNMDSITQSSLQLIAQTDKGVPGTYARNCLIAAQKLTYREPVNLPDTGLKSSKKKKFKGAKEPYKSTILSVFPNPAHDYFVVKTKFDTLTGPGVLTLYNSNGWAVESYPVTKKQNQIVISTVNLKSGLYILALELDNKKSDKVKIAIIK